VSPDLGPVDAAARGVATSGGAVTLYAEQLVAPGGGTGMVELDNHTVVGTELAADLYFNTIPLRLTGGVAIRLPHNRGGAQEMLVYLNLGGLAAEQVSNERGAATGVRP
ncbi:MAG: hypothetical protein PF508_02120, partial [Spirochaeta sp.]|nr:hypothetical protein [Spirochaeta sp.]